MRVFLIVLVILSYLSGVTAIITYSVDGGSLRIDMLGIMLVVVIINILSARYLYLRAPTKKVEWALFGLVGNVNAILFFWVWKRITSHWKSGRGLFDPR
jgi:hypothetical protein